MVIELDVTLKLICFVCFLILLNVLIVFQDKINYLYTLLLFIVILFTILIKTILKNK
jgi:hypothetical protein